MSFYELLILLFFFFIVILILPKLRTGIGTFLTLVLWAGFIAINRIRDPFSNFWLKITLPTLILIGGYFIIIFKRRWAAKKIRGEGPSTFSGDQRDDYPTMPQDSDAKLTIVGSTIGRYEILKEIGHNSMGEIFSGRDSKTGEHVAIKTVRFSEFDDDHISEIRDRFFRETECLLQLKHPNIVTVYDCGEGQDLFYVVTEDLESEDVKNHTKKGQLLPMREALNIIGYAAEALDYACRKNVIHQHVGPESIIRVKKTNCVKIKDFGVGRIRSALESKSGTLTESYRYMSPEQIAGKRVDGRSDIFSLGVVLFEMLTGERPFEGEDMSSIMLNISKDKHLSPRFYNSKIPRVIEKIIDRTLEKDVEKRYQDAGQLAIHLKRVVAKIDELIDQKRACSPSSL